MLLGAHGIAVAQELDGLHFEPMVLFEGISGDGSSLLVRRPDSSSLRSLATGAEQTIIEGVPAVPTARSGDGSTAIG